MSIEASTSLTSTVISALFVLFVLRQFLERRKVHQLIWTIALGIWTVAVAMEAVAAVSGWSPIVYRIYYATGALQVPAWLGLGTIYLIASRRIANASAVFLIVAALVGVILIFTAPIKVADLAQTDETGSVVVKVFPVYIRLLVGLLNALGSIAFVGGAIYSLGYFWRQRIMGDRVIGVALIALGGIVAAVAHTIGAFGGPELFRISELVAVILIFLGFLKASVSPTVAEAQPKPAREPA